jgi:hypothetical protein
VSAGDAGYEEARPTDGAVARAAVSEVPVGEAPAEAVGEAVEASGAADEVAPQEEVGDVAATAAAGGGGAGGGAGGDGEPDA